MSDYIDRTLLTKPIYAEDDNATGFGMTEYEQNSYNEGIDVAWNRVLAAPTVDAVPVVHGRWMQRANGEVYCSHCNRTVGVGNLDEVTEEEHYCYNCGARMDGDD